MVSVIICWTRSASFHSIAPKRSHPPAGDRPSSLAGVHCRSLQFRVTKRVADRSRNPKNPVFIGLSAFRQWFRWYSGVVEVPVRIEIAAGFVAPGASEPPRLQPKLATRRIRTRAWMKQGYCVAPACTSELHPVADEIPHAPSMTPVAMEHRHRLADVLGHVDEVDYHTVRSTAALARSSGVSAPSTSATHPGAQPAPSRGSTPGGVAAGAAASARHRRPPRPDRRPRRRPAGIRVCRSYWKRVRGSDSVVL